MAAASLPRADRAARASLAAALFVGAIGSFVLAGWILDIDQVKGAYGGITMKTNAAIGLLLCALSLAARRVNLKVIGTLTESHLLRRYSNELERARADLAQ